MIETGSQGLTDTSWVDDIKAGDLVSARHDLTLSGRHHHQTFNVKKGTPVLIAWIISHAGDQLSFSLIIDNRDFTATMVKKQFARAFNISSRCADGI